MLEFLAYAALLIGLPILAPLWIARGAYRYTTKTSGQALFAALFATAIGLFSFLVLGYVGFLSAALLGCRLNKTNPECEYIAFDTVFGTL